MLRELISAYRQAFRIYLRQRLKPMSEEEAEEKKLFWSKCYMFCGLMTLFMATYVTGKHNINFPYRTDISKDKAVVEKLKNSPTKVIYYRNFEKVEEYDYTPNEVEKKDSWFHPSPAPEPEEKRIE